MSAACVELGRTQFASFFIRMGVGPSFPWACFILYFRHLHLFSVIYKIIFDTQSAFVLMLCLDRGESGGVEERGGERFNEPYLRVFF